MTNHKETVQTNEMVPTARVYDIAAEIALKYSLEECGAENCKRELCARFETKKCEVFRSPTGEVEGLSAPVMRVYTSDDHNVVILVTYFVGPTKPFLNFGPELRSTIENRLGLHVDLSSD